MENIFIRNLNEKDVEHCTTNIGLYLRRRFDKPFKKACNLFTGANIIRINTPSQTDEEYFEKLSPDFIPIDRYDLKKGKNNIVLERYPQLNSDEPYIFVCNHTCPEDIETVLNILDRNAYLILGSIETLKHNPEMYLSWLNGMLPFDILNPNERKGLMPKMKRVLQTNSILIFPEGSHNYSPNKLINNLYDGPVNLSLQTGRKIVIVTLLKDNENDVAYIDVSNPIDLTKIPIEIPVSSKSESEKRYVKALSLYIRDKMATAVYYMIMRHFKPVTRKQGENIEAKLRLQKIQDAFKKLKWDKDVFDAEYLVKKTHEEKEYEDVVRSLSNLRLNYDVIRSAQINHREYVLKKMDLDSKDVAKSMRQYWLKTRNGSKTLTKRK